LFHSAATLAALVALLRVSRTVVAGCWGHAMRNKIGRYQEELKLMGWQFRQSLWCLQGTLAREVGRLCPRTPQERRSERRRQGPRHDKAGCQAHPSQPSPQAAPPHIPCSRSCMSICWNEWNRQRLIYFTDQPVHVEPLPHRIDPDGRS
jgi:hypothetical protein